MDRPSQKSWIFWHSNCWLPIWWAPYFDRLVAGLGMPDINQVDRKICNSSIVTEVLSLAFYLSARRREID